MYISNAFGTLLGVHLYATYNFPQIWIIDQEHTKDDSCQITFFLYITYNFPQIWTIYWKIPGTIYAKYLFCPSNHKKVIESQSTKKLITCKIVMLCGRLSRLRLGYLYGTYNFSHIWTIDQEDTRDGSFQITFLSDTP